MTNNNSLFSKFTSLSKRLFHTSGTWLLLLLFMALVYYKGLVWQSLKIPPQSLHISAQCDRASIARNFYEEDMNIFLPKINNMERKTGIAAAEFPLIPYLAACCYHLFGFHNFWFRFITFIFFSVGFIFSFKLSLLLTGNKTVSYLVCFLWLCSPTLLYYIPNFNPDPAALGVTMVAWYYFFLWHKEQHFSYLLILSITCSLAILLKASAAISIIAMLLLLIIDTTGLLDKEGKRMLPRKAALLITLLTSTLLAYFWYDYAKALNEKYFSVFFTLETRTPTNIHQIRVIWEYLKDKWITHYYSQEILWLIVLLHFLLLLLHKKIPRHLLMLTWMLTVGSLSFIFLMFIAFKHHDYYIIALLPWIFFLFLSSGIGLMHWIKNKIIRMALVLLVTVFITINISYCSEKNTLLYDHNNTDLYQPEFYGYYDTEPAMRKAGIKRNDYIISVTDPTYDVSLYLMNQKGYTITDKKDINKIFNRIISWDAKYVVTNSDECLPDLPVVKKLLGNPVLMHKNLRFYKVNLKDTVLINQIHQIIHNNIDRQIIFFDNNLPTRRYFKKFCRITGVTYDAVMHDACLYQLKNVENTLTPELSVFAIKNFHTDSISEEILNSFSANRNLDSISRYILLHPYQSWFDHFD